MNRVFFYSLRLLLPAFVSITSSLHAAESEEVSAVDVDAILAAQPAAVPIVVSQTKLFRASNADAGDYFQAVAISGDTVVIGAPFEDSSGEGVNSTKQGNNSLVHSGAAYVYVRDGEKWIQQAYLKASNSGKNDQFGFSVAISGDTIAIGAFGEDSKSSTQTDNSATDAGAVYVFTRKDKIWTQQAYLKSSTAAAGNFFGYSVAISENSLVVGAMGENGGTSSGTGTTATTIARAGTAYVFTRSTTTWAQQASLKASNPGANDLFGISVGISGDTVVVGAQNESSDSTGVNGAQDDDTQSNSGAAYVFTRSSSTWSQQAYLKASNTAKDDLFGHAVAIDGRTIVVGAHQESSKARGVNKNQSDNSAAKSGAAYVFIRNGKKWLQQAYLKPSNTGAGDGFGYSVAVSGASVLIGSYGEDSNARGIQGDQGNNSALNSGAAYLFTRSGTTWSQKSYLKPSNTANNGQFGKYAAIDDDIALVAAPGMSKYSGAAYLFEGSRAPSPEIVIERQVTATPATYANLLNGSASVDFGNHRLGEIILPEKRKQTFRIRNTGDRNLSGLSAAISGKDAANYELVTTGMSSNIQSGESTTFTVALLTTGSASAERIAAITVKSNDADESEFKISLTGLVLSDTADTDGDKLNDYAEAQYAALGFDWKKANIDLVTTLNNGASAARLFTTTQVETAVKLTTPVLTKSATTGKFTLKVGLEQSTNLKDFSVFPMSAGTFKDGKLEFEFTSPSNATFYRVLGK